MAAESTGPRAGTPVGLALVRDAEVLGAEPFFHEFIAGMERVLVPLGVPVLLQVVATIAQAADRMRAWAEEDQVQGVILIDLLPGDERVALVRELGMPAVVIGDPVTAGGLPAVWTQDEVAMRGVVDKLVAGGHDHLGHVAGPADMAHTIIRRRTFADVAAEHGVRTTTFDGDYSEAAGVCAVTALASIRDRPTALVFDNDVMALGALHEAARLGFAVPADLSLVAWDDSALCQLAEPPLSAVSHDVQALGVLVGETLAEVLSGATARVITAAPATLVVRGSSI
ncbi:LacI family DNA-binding transcriptional regulator [Planotetraspora phitsanulokensis]|uniref:LacI family transcriptional regulator n=1 Tax=Planotetraspora phitsanulokensis TaxID=575192 RepID=A0A8J3UB25_9ACTN|nr:LacI family DNA-binding transcriptional regulator [Planotetraspora phitsanulokensis]GII41560.1 LacI family transcriptional regulator [Planotetraspora phitsanulokensis]